MIELVTQRCPRCKKHKAIECFPETRRRGRKELFCYCIKCKKDYDKEWRIKNKGYFAEYDKKYGCRERKEKWLKKNPDYMKKYYLKRKRLSLIKERHLLRKVKINVL